MRSNFVVTDVVISAPSDEQRALGAVGLVALTIDGRLRLNAFILTPRPDGSVDLNYFCAPSPEGHAQPVIMPLDAETHRVLVEAVMAEHRRQVHLGGGAS